jgi:hypothetical protein
MASITILMDNSALDQTREVAMRTHIYIASFCLVDMRES